MKYKNQRKSKNVVDFRTPELSIKNSQKEQDDRHRNLMKSEDDIVQDSYIQLNRDLRKTSKGKDWTGSREAIKERIASTKKSRPLPKKDSNPFAKKKDFFEPKPYKGNK